MSKPNLPYYFEWSRQFAHIAAVDLFGKQIATEIAVMAIDNRNGDLYFIRLDYLDPIDIKRLRQIILARDSSRYALWDLMSNKTLPNGMNALEFFQQFVQVRTVGGEIVRPGAARGLPIGEFGYKGPAAHGFADPNAKATSNAASAQQDHDVDYVELDEGYDEEDAPAAVAAPKRKAGRPKKVAK